ncbi:putative F-box/FBD/LRR-repeat protein At1g78760 isoform X2 [Carex rostrata]
MATSPIDQIDRFSDLPDTLIVSILSLLPTRIAARTTALSRRFRHLWEASPSVDLPIKYIPFFKYSTYIAMVNSALLNRKPSNPILRLHFEFGPLPCYLTHFFICSLFVHAHAIGLRHLTIDGTWDIQPVILSIFSISSLESLSIYILPDTTFPSAINLTRLKSLSINLISCNSTIVERLLSELCCLEDLQLRMSSGVVCLSSRTIKKLELLLVGASPPEPYSLELSMPSLEFLCLRNRSVHANIPLIHGEIPFIRKAVVSLDCLRQKHVTAVAQFLNCISDVEELSLDLKEHVVSDYPFPVLLEPGKEVPTFPNLKHLDMSMCFHKCNIETVVTMLHHSTALESLKLHHKSTDFLGVKRGKRNAWRSMLPRNSDRNNQYACFKNLHFGGKNRKEFEKLLNIKCTPKRQRAGS